MKLFYLGPEGSFTFQAARIAGTKCFTNNEIEYVACASEREIFNNVEQGRGDGIIAWENNVEGYVATNLDRLMNSHNVAGTQRISLNIQFDAFVRPDCGEITEVTAHPHGLAQCTQFIEEHNLREVPSSSNSAACKDLKPHQVALAPHKSGELYGLHTWQESVQDYAHAHTDFLLLQSREKALDTNTIRENCGIECETILTVIPLSIGPGVIANLLDVFRDNGLNMTSLISRPIKGVDGTYSFVITIDAAPWESSVQHVFQEIEEHGDWLKIMAVYPQRTTHSLPIKQWNLPHRGINAMLTHMRVSQEHGLSTDCDGESGEEQA
ncbi:chorismate mutase [Alloscardovia theropitheci]|uniref:Prephenate dehydratase n=1 Tax=Alloscardovia theropitheci TaxID=2496842 RepID=A0A4R0QYF5_9BIFI|nr:prephenate dehydratase domain-containing protein [Alloscardovia theropitheci]TCD54641.1 chorismate mutase [Alloscardovia theropitheci]